MRELKKKGIKIKNNGAAPDLRQLAVDCVTRGVNPNYNYSNNANNNTIN